MFLCTSKQPRSEIMPRARAAVLVIFGLAHHATAFMHNMPLSTLHRRRPHIASVIMNSEGPCQDESGIKADAEAAFRLLDLNGDGGVCKAEFAKYLRQYKYTDSAADKIFEALDFDSNGEVSMSELRDGLVDYCRCSQCEPNMESAIKANADSMFAEIDMNSDGEISTTELRQLLLSRNYTDDAVDAVFLSLDTNNDGTLSREELRTGFIKYERLRMAMVAIVTTLVKLKRWSPAQASAKEGGGAQRTNPPAMMAAPGGEPSADTPPADAPAADSVADVAARMRDLEAEVK